MSKFVSMANVNNVHPYSWVCVSTLLLWVKSTGILHVLLVHYVAHIAKHNDEVNRSASWIGPLSDTRPSRLGNIRYQNWIGASLFMHFKSYCLLCLCPLSSFLCYFYHFVVMMLWCSSIWAVEFSTEITIKLTLGSMAEKFRLNHFHAQYFFGSFLRIPCDLIFNKLSKKDKAE